MYKSIILIGSLNIIKVSWIQQKATANPLTNSYQTKEFYYLKKSGEGRSSYQFYLYQGNNNSMQEKSKANIKAALGENYITKVDALEKVNLKAVIKMVVAFNKVHPIAS
jgi:hypothetical protein